MPRRRAVVAGLIAAPLVIGGAVALLRSLPALVREQLAARIKARTGLEVSVGEASVGFSSIEVASLECGRAGGPRLIARSIELDAGALMLALRGSRAVERVRVGKLELGLPLAAASTRELLARLRGGAAGARAQRRAEAGQGLPALAIDALQLELTDAHGVLASVRGGRASFERGVLQASAGEARLGEADADQTLQLQKVSAALRDRGGGLELTTLTVAKATALIGPARAAEAAARAGGASLISRLLAARHLLLAPPAPAGSGGPAASGKPARRLAAGAVLRIDDGAMLARGAVDPIMRGLKAKAVVSAERSIALTGGATARTGDLKWDLVLRPDAAQADGRVDVRSIPLDLIAPFLPGLPWHEPEQGRLDAGLVVTAEPEGVRFEGQVALRDAALASARLAPQPVRGIEVTLDGRGRLLPLRRRLELTQAELRIRGVAVQVTGAVERSPEHYLFDVSALMPPAPCTDAVRAIPEDLLGDMALATWSGRIGGRLQLKLDSRALPATVLEIDPQDRCEFVAVPAMADLRRFQQPFVHSVLEPDGSTFEMETGPGTASWTYLEDVSPFLVHAVLAHEDAGFFKHRGFSLPHVRNALVRNLQEGRYAVGASTITMQLVKNVLLHREKTLARKIQEVLLTWWIERVMEKRDVLELYLNVIELAPGVYGLRNGAKHYFNRLPAQLSPAEAVYLSTILPNPKRYHSHFENKALSPQWVEIMRRMLVRLRDRGSYDPDAAAYGLAELESFRFVPEGTVVPSRIVPGSAAPLPYMRTFGGGEVFGDEPSFDDGTWDMTPESDDDSPPPRSRERPPAPGPRPQAAP